MKLSTPSTVRSLGGLEHDVRVSNVPARWTMDENTKKAIYVVAAASILITLIDAYRRLQEHR